MFQVKSIGRHMMHRRRRLIIKPECGVLYMYPQEQYYCPEGAVPRHDRSKSLSLDQILYTF